MQRLTDRRCFVGSGPGPVLSLGLSLFLLVAVRAAQAADAPRLAYAGVAVRPVDPVVHRHLPVLNGAGLTVRAIEPGSPAARAGLRRHDILLQWEEQRLFTPGQLRGLLGTLEPGQVQRVTVLRQAGLEHHELVLGARTIESRVAREVRVARVPYAGWQSAAELPGYWAELLGPVLPAEKQEGPEMVHDPERLLGFQSRAADEALFVQVAIGNRAGVVIEGLQVGSPAEQAGLESGDIVVGLQGAFLTTPDQFTERLGGLPSGSLLTFTVWREGRTVDLEMTLPAPVPADPQEPPALAALPGGVGVSDWLHAAGDNVDWILLLESETGAGTEQAITSAVPESSPSLDPLGAAAAGGGYALADDRGSIEVQQRGGRDHVIIRNAQGSLLYEGRMDTEADRLLLRPLAPELRESVEDFVGSERALGAVAEVRVWRWRFPADVL